MGSRKRKGFSRSQKAWEESIATHIGKVIDNATPAQLLDLTAALVSTYYGYKAAELTGAKFPDSLKGAGVGLIAYRLARSRNLIAGASGTLGLAGIGLVNVWNPLRDILPDIGDWGAWFKGLFPPIH